MDILSQALTEPIRPTYTIHDYAGTGIYKIVKFKSTAPRMYLNDKDRCNHYDKKIDASLSRAKRVVFELALCNNWKYFCTFTIAKENFDRTNLEVWHKKFTQWLRDQRKKYSLKFEFLLVPELHDDGEAWHMHGLFSDISPLLVSFADLRRAGNKIPHKLAFGGFLNWPAYQVKFGFCSFGVIRNKVATAYYVTKYITKQLELSAISVGSHLYYYSRGLRRSSKHGDVYGDCSELDKHLDHDYDFCKTGMTSVKDGYDWSFAFEYMEFELLEAFKCDNPIEALEVDNYFEAVQAVIKGF